MMTHVPDSGYGVVQRRSVEPPGGKGWEWGVDGAGRRTKGACAHARTCPAAAALAAALAACSFSSFDRSMSSLMGDSTSFGASVQSGTEVWHETPAHIGTAEQAGAPFSPLASRLRACSAAAALSSKYTSNAFRAVDDCCGSTTNRQSATGWATESGSGKQRLGLGQTATPAGRLNDAGRAYLGNHRTAGSTARRPRMIRTLGCRPACGTQRHR